MDVILVDMNGVHPKSMKMGESLGNEVVPQWHCESEGQSDPGVKGTPKCIAPLRREHAR